MRGRIRIVAEPLLYPLTSVERVEDPRVWVGDGLMELYHVRAVEPYVSIGNADSFVITFRSVVVNGVKPEGIEPVRFVDPESGEEVIIRDCRDTFPLNKEFMIFRPWIGVGGVLIAPRHGALIRVREVKAYPELMPSPKTERKTGGNCVIKVSSNEHLLLFHSVEKVFGSYYTYAALLSGDGELLGVTPNPVIGPRQGDYYGARPSTVFVCGGALINNSLILSAGKDDEAVLILEVDLEKVMECMKFLRP